MRKKNILLIAIIFMTLAKLHGQPVINSTLEQGTGKSVFSIDVNSPNTGLGKILEPGDLHNRGEKRTKIFIEYGDGAFSTQGTSNHKILLQNYPVLLFATGIYDTTRPKATRYAFMAAGNSTTGNLSSSSAFSSNDQPVLPPGKSIYVTPNVMDIVPNDDNTFAITYKLKDSALPLQYKILFYYNSNPVFDFGNTDLLRSSIPPVRTFYNDVSASTISPESYRGLKDLSGIYTNCIKIDLGTGNYLERNAFVTLTAKPDVELNSVTNIYVMLISSFNAGPWTIVDDYLINSMPVSLAHDPNYIRQTGQCLELPKVSKIIKYHVHFQNDGKGEAGQVDVHVKLPPGIDDRNITFGSAKCADKEFDRNSISGYDIENHTLFFTFKNASGVLLKGTDNNVNPMVNPNTMGDIFFSVPEKYISSDTLPAYADIYFYNVGSSTPLPPVRTNLALSVYRSKCDPTKTEKIDCDTCNIWRQKNCKNEKCNCTRVFYICWYWWLLLIPLFILVYLVYKRYKKKSNPAA